MSDTKVYEPSIRALLGTASHFCEGVVVNRKLLTGTNGVDGSAGVNGVAGPAGIPGAQGAAGQAGSNGAHGTSHGTAVSIRPNIVTVNSLLLRITAV